MKVYVDKLPKDCWNCPCAIKSQRQQFKDKERMMDTFMEDCMHCIPLDKWIVEKHKNCPLQSLRDYTKQVRKEVCEEIINFIKYNGKYEYNNNNLGVFIVESLFLDFLDQIQGE